MVANDDAEFLLACKDLTEAEQRTLDQQLELLLGQSVWEGGTEPTKGYFIHDRLIPWMPPPGVA